MIVEKVNLPPLPAEIKKLAKELLDDPNNQVDSHNSNLILYSGVNQIGTTANYVFCKNTQNRKLISGGFVKYSPDLEKLKLYYQSILNIPFPIHLHLQACYSTDTEITGPANCGPAHRFTTGPSIVIPITDNIHIRTFSEKPTQQVIPSDMWKIPKGFNASSFNGIYDRETMTPMGDISLDENVSYIVNWKDAILEELQSGKYPSYKIILGILATDSMTAGQVNSWIKI